ncbi:MAG: hypothetical protein DKINENOH_03068 [bacterium]|nr:hypothetical protein [bacterium]
MVPCCKSGKRCSEFWGQCHLPSESCADVHEPRSVKSLIDERIEMKKQSLLTAMAAIPVILFMGIARSQTNQNIEVAKLKDNYYKLTSKLPYEVNFLVYVTPEGVLMVDSGQRETSNEIKPILKTIAPDNPEVRILINTHAHIDHTGGNLALAGEPLIIGPEILRTTLQDFSYVLYEFPDNALPSVTFKDSLHVYFGGEKIRLIAVPGSHDATDIIVHFTEAGIVCVGDIYEGMTIPSIDAYTGNLLMFPEVIGKILTLIPDRVMIFSGHDMPCDMKKFKQSGEMILNTTRIVNDEMAKGKDVAAMQKEDILKNWAEHEGGFGGNRNDWINALASAGPSKFINSLAKELYVVLQRSDGAAAVVRYYELKKEHPAGYPFVESLIRRTGDWLLSKGRADDAIKIFELDTKEFPNSSLAYNGLGEAYLKAGKNEQARESFEKSLELNPANENARKMLQQLGTR